MHERARCCDEASNHQLPVAMAFWIIWIISAAECSSLRQDLMWRLSVLSNFEWEGCTVHMPTPRCLPPSLTSTVKSSLFTHVHSSSFFLAARLHQCCVNHFHINNGWTVSGQAFYLKQRKCSVHEDSSCLLSPFSEKHEDDWTEKKTGEKARWNILGKE